MNILRIATRKSPLAVWQAEYVAACLEKAHPTLKTELVKMSTKGDKILDTPLAKIGGKGLFVKELEWGILEGRADIAVHSMKDVPVESEIPEGLHLACIMSRHDPRDAFVSNKYKNLADLPQNAIIGTASLRRQCQLLKQRPDLKIKSLRGNVNSRLQKLDDGQYDAIVLAASGLQRLGFEARITDLISVNDSLPAIGQGALGIECRQDDPQTNDYLNALMDLDTYTCVMAERALNQQLEGGCQVPIAGYATLNAEQMTLTGLVGKIDGSTILKTVVTGDRNDPTALGQAAAADLIQQGAKSLLAELYS